MSGILFTLTPLPNNETIAYTVDAGKLVSLSLTVCNRNTQPSLISIAVSGVGLTKSYIHFNSSLNSFSTMEHKLMIKEGQVVHVTSSTENVDFVGNGAVQTV